MIDTHLLRCGLFGHQWGPSRLTPAVYPNTTQVRMVHRTRCHRCSMISDTATGISVAQWEVARDMGRT